MSNHDFRLHNAKNFVSVTLSDSNTITITDDTVTDKSVSDDIVGAQYCRGFHCNDSGDVYVDDAAGQLVNQKMSLNSGQTYPYSIKRFRTTGASGSITHGSILAFK